MSATGSGVGNDEITITLVSPLTGQSESIAVASSTTRTELCDWSRALGLLSDNTADGQVIFEKDGKEIKEGTNLQSMGLVHGDLIAVSGRQIIQSQNQRQTRSTAGVDSASSSSAAGGLDFSALLGAAAGGGGASGSTAPPSASPAPAASGLLDFSGILGGSATQQQQQPSLSIQSTPIEWPGMNLDDCMMHNPNPTCFIDVLASPQHPNLLKELSHHQPKLGKQLGDLLSQSSANNPQKKQEAVQLWRQQMVQGSIARAVAVTSKRKEESTMQQRLAQNPNDKEAKAYFEKRENAKLIQAQYHEMMENYPESMGQVLMLYVQCKIHNSVPLQAFVDSGAQSTIISLECAKRCGLSHLIDERFAGTAVGVGKGKILGRIHVVMLEFTASNADDNSSSKQSYYFPCSVTVIENLGNMDFLLGLDMLKRHKATLDLANHCLRIPLPQGGFMEAPFLHEKDLDQSRGGTKGFDAVKANQQVQERLDKMESDQKMDEDDD